MQDFSRGEIPSIQDTGASIDRVAKLARLVLVLEGTRVTHLDGRSHPESVFAYLPDTPLGRANIECGLDVDILKGIVGDAQKLSYDEFADRFPKFGPYES